MKHKDCGGQIIVWEAKTTNYALLGLDEDNSYLYNPTDPIDEDIEDSGLSCAACREAVYEEDVEP